MDTTSNPASTDLIRAADVEIVVARLGTELSELECRLVAATQAATHGEARAREAGTDLEASAWMMVRLHRYLEDLVRDAETENRELLDLARRQALKYPPARVLPRAQPAAPPASAASLPLVRADLAVAAPVPAEEEIWDPLAGPAGRDPNEPFWPDGTGPAPESAPGEKHAASVTALLRLGSVVCIAGAGFLRFG